MDYFFILDKCGKNHNLKLLCFNPASIEELPDDSKLQDFVKKFGNFHHIRRGIEINEKPLDFTNDEIALMESKNLKTNGIRKSV